MITTTFSLESELQTFSAEFERIASADARAATERFIAELAASRKGQPSLKAGEAAPHFTLSDRNGTKVSLIDLVRQGPVVISFFRGRWCSYCSLELRALERALPVFEDLGASLVAISPEKSNVGLTGAVPQKIAMPILHDQGNSVAAMFGITFDLSEELRTIYRHFGHDLPAINDTGNWILPIPATFVVDSGGIIQFASVDPDYRNRPEPATIEKILRGISEWAGD